MTLLRCFLVLVAASASPAQCKSDSAVARVTASVPARIFIGTTEKQIRVSYNGDSFLEIEIPFRVKTNTTCVSVSVCAENLHYADMSDDVSVIPIDTKWPLRLNYFNRTASLNWQDSSPMKIRSTQAYQIFAIDDASLDTTINIQLRYTRTCDFLPYGLYTGQVKLVTEVLP